MNSPSAITTRSHHNATHLLDIIRKMHASVGDGLNDEEFTCLLQKTALPDEAGFMFLSYSNQFVTLTVPRQNLANWYPETGWMASEKEKAARAIAERYQLSLFEPPDAVYSSLDLPDGHHHHLEMNDREGMVIAVHPRYLKVRLFASNEHAGYARNIQRPLLLGPDLLRDLSALYQD